MKPVALLTCFFLFSYTAIYCQTENLLVGPGINLPSDSVTRTALLGSLRGWLDQKGKPDKENAYIAPDDLAATSAFMEEIRGLDRRVVAKDTSYYKCYLTNVLAVDSAEFQVQLAYMGVRGGEANGGVGGGGGVMGVGGVGGVAPDLRACCTVMARKKGGQYYFSTPLQQYTLSWKTRQIGNCTFHYKTDINLKKAGAYQKKIAFYDQKLTTTAQTIDFYCCDNFPEAGRLLGLDYKADYNGLVKEEVSGFSANHTVVICGFGWADGFSDWDPHDAWHGRLYDLLRSNKVNRPMDEACAYVYGGSWRTYNPSEILRLFREYAVAHPDADWLTLYKDGTNFVPPPKILKISYAINALIIGQLEKEKGFPAVLELLTCGKKEPGDANYFAAVQRLTGVDTAGYNAYVWKLIRNQ